MKIDPYYPRRKCNAETLLCEAVRVMPIFVGVAGYGTSNESGVVENASFLPRSLYLSHEVPPLALHIEIYTASRGFLAIARPLYYFVPCMPQTLKMVVYHSVESTNKK